MVPEEQQKSSVEETFGPVIYSYSRAQAIEDGVLVDLTANFPNDTRLYRWPVACTSTVWNLIEKASQKIPGGPDPWVWDLCWMSIKAKTKVFSDREHLFVHHRTQGPYLQSELRSRRPGRTRHYHYDVRRGLTRKDQSYERKSTYKYNRPDK